MRDGANNTLRANNFRPVHSPVWITSGRISCRAASEQGCADSSFGIQAKTRGHHGELGSVFGGGQNAIITGGAMGIGFGIARRFIEGGANVLVTDVAGESARAAVDQLVRLGAGRAAAATADVADTAQAPRVVAQCADTFGGVDVLVNNAGIFPTVRMLEATPELFERVLRVNLVGLAFMSQAAGRRMREQGRGGRVLRAAHARVPSD